MTWSDVVNTHFRRADQEITIKELCFNNHIATEREKNTITNSVVCGNELCDSKVFVG